MEGKLSGRGEVRGKMSGSQCGYIPVNFLALIAHGYVREIIDRWV